MSRSWRKAVISFRGGLNLNPDSDDAIGEGIVLKNYEQNDKGNPQRIEGIERFDGRPRPSDFAVTSSVDDDDFYAQLYAGINSARALITQVPGSGPVRGVALFKDKVYAWRDNIGGTFTNVFQSSGAGWVAATGFPVNSLAVGGRVRTVQANFIGSSAGRKLYGADGANKAFMYDGTVFTQLTTGTPIDKPIHIIEHQDHLWLAFRGGSLQHSKLGDPTDYTSGAGEIGIGDEITGLAKPPGGALLVMSQGRLDLIYGKTIDTFQRADFNEEMGGFENTLQIVADTILGNHQGFMVLPRTDTFGDFEYNSNSEKIKEHLNFTISPPTASCVVGKKNQYRVFFENGEGYNATFRGNVLLGWTNFTYGQGRAAYCLGKGNDSSKQERIFIGSIDGFVYELDRGRSIDGDEIATAFRLAYAAIGGKDQEVRVHRAILEADAIDKTTLEMNVDFEYGSEDIPQGNQISIDLVGGGGFWGNSSYGQIRYGIPYRQRIDIDDIEGFGTNISILFNSLSALDLPHTLRSITIFYTFHGRK